MDAVTPIQKCIPAIQSNRTVRVAFYYLVFEDTKELLRAGRSRAFFLSSSAGRQAGRPVGVERLAASYDSSPLMSLTAINSTLGSRAQHSPPPAALGPGLGFLCTPLLSMEGLELKLEFWQWAM